MKSDPIIFLLVCCLLCALSVPVSAQDTPLYDIGAPVLTDVYVSPTGDDASSGATRAQPLRTLTAAWERIPMGAELTTGYRIRLLPGAYLADSVPVYWESRYGTFEHPIIIEAADGPDTVTLPGLNVFDTRYLYLLNLTIQAGTDALHCEKCDHLLLRGMRITGADPDTYNAQETVKINQSQYIYLEDSDISGAWDNAVDFVAVQYGHIVGSRIHNAGDWCLYLKGGSAYFRVDANELFDCGTGGFTAGQGTGFQFMTPPWIHYEAYDIKFINNVVHDTRGAGAGVQGGYNILIAYNTFYRVGENSHALEIGFGSRSCDGQPGDAGRERCAEYLAAGGWGTTAVDDGTNYVRIPNRNVYLYNNILYNPPGYQSQYQHFSIFAPYSGETQTGANVPVPTLADDNLQIRGNILWNGPADLPLGVEDSAGCAPSNPTCNASELRADNFINQFEPQLADPASGDFRPVAGGSVFTPGSCLIPDFTWDDAPPGVPPGDPDNVLDFDYEGVQRLCPGVRGAFETAAPAAGGLPAPGVPTLPTSAPVEAAPLPFIPPGPITFIALGDSLTQGDGDEAGKGGYPGRLLALVETLRPGSTMTNLGQSGWNSDALINGDQGIASQLDRAVEQIQASLNRGIPAVALVWIGSNDLFYLYEYNDPDADGETADLAHYAANLDTILSRLRKAGAVIFVALLDDQSQRPVTQNGEAFTGISRDEISRMAQQVTRYNAAIRQKAAEYRAITVDFYSTTIFTDPAALYSDGNHPNPAGYDRIAQRWFDAMKPALGG